MDPGWQLGIWGDRAGGRIPRYLSDFWRRENEVWGDCRGRMDWGSTFKPKGEEELCVVFTDRWTGEEVRGCDEKGRADTNPLRTFEREMGGKREGGAEMIYPRTEVI